MDECHDDTSLSIAVALLIFFTQCNHAASRTRGSVKGGGGQLMYSRWQLGGHGFLTTALTSPNPDFLPLLLHIFLSHFLIAFTKVKLVSAIQDLTSSQ